jgi:hypothetical protein
MTPTFHGLRDMLVFQTAWMAELMFRFCTSCRKLRL